MNYRLEFRAPSLETAGEYTFDVGSSLIGVLQSLPGRVEFRPPTPQERFEDVCREIREQRYVLLRDPHEHDWDD